MSKIPKDYLKYYRIIFYYYRRKYDVSQQELDMLLFLYSEGYFDYIKIKDYQGILSWNKNRIKTMIEKGLIEIFREKPRTRRLYQLSKKGRNIVNGIYEKLNGDRVPATYTNNPMFAKNVSYSDKVYKQMIKKMNEARKLQQHQLPEL